MAAFNIKLTAMSVIKLEATVQEQDCIFHNKQLGRTELVSKIMF